MQIAKFLSGFDANFKWKLYSQLLRGERLFDENNCQDTTKKIDRNIKRSKHETAQLRYMGKSSPLSVHLYLWTHFRNIFC